MTIYKITLGYNSVYTEHSGDGWETLKETVTDICSNPNSLLMEILEEFKHRPLTINYQTLHSYITAYRLPIKDLTLEIREADKTVVQIASGSRESRRIKELYRRAFCRMVMLKMHQKGYEVNINVS